jgi:hypothetical protein
VTKRLRLRAATFLRNRVAHALDFPRDELEGSRLSYQGNHGTKALAAARAAACWAIKERLPELSHREIGLVVGLKHSAVRQAILRAPKTFKASELERFAGRRR